MGSNKGKREIRSWHEVKKPRGMERGLEIEEIVGEWLEIGLAINRPAFTEFFMLSGVANVGKTPRTLMFLVRWMGCEELDLVPASEINSLAPEVVIAYYEERSAITKRFEQKQKERLVAALRPSIISKLEHIPHPDLPESIQPDESEIFSPIIQEQQEAMVRIPQDFNTDIPLIVATEHQQDWPWPRSIFSVG